MSLFAEHPAEVQFTYQGKVFTLLFDMPALRRFEYASGISPLDVVDHLDDIANGRARPRIAMLGDLLLAGLVARHPDLDVVTATNMATDVEVLAGIIEGYAEAMPSGDGVAADPSPPAGGKRKAAKPPKGKRARSTGTR